MGFCLIMKLDDIFGELNTTQNTQYLKDTFNQEFKAN